MPCVCCLVGHSQASHRGGGGVLVERESLVLSSDSVLG